MVDYIGSPVPSNFKVLEVFNLEEFNPIEPNGITPLPPNCGSGFPARAGTVDTRAQPREKTVSYRLPCHVFIGTAKEAKGDGRSCEAS